MRILVSACLLGHAVRYDGGHRRLGDHRLESWRREGALVPFCPEVAAGLAVPRPPAEIEPGKDADDVLNGRGRILTSSGEDVSQAFMDGAARALAEVLAHRCRFALLTDGSPSCGSTFVYSGHFDGRRQVGLGVVAALLTRHGVAVYPAHEIEALAADREIALSELNGFR
ncbi:MAG: DUF523 domain-containing protein [Geminicoccaceae bacterium]